MPPEGTVKKPDTPFQKAIKYLCRREYYTKELKWKLNRDGYQEEAVDEALAKLLASGRLSDGRFVDAYVAERRRRLYGPERIRMELIDKGFDEAEIRRGLAADDEQWLENARRCCDKRFGATTPADYREYTRRRNYLHRRGYSVGVIRSVLPDAPGN